MGDEHNSGNQIRYSFCNSPFVMSYTFIIDPTLDRPVERLLMQLLLTIYHEVGLLHTTKA